MSATTHYETLNVPPAANIDQIKAAHRTLARLFHPDRSMAEDAHQIMTMVNGAYAVLGDKLARRRYDALLAPKAAERCPRCEGRGQIRRMQGFKQLPGYEPCPVCAGSGEHR